VLERRYRGPSRFARLTGRPSAGPLPFAHLIDHSDADGYYVPVEFPDPLVAGDEMVGSSQQLLAECEALAAALGIPDDLDPEAEVLWAASEGQTEGGELWQRYGVESFVCVRLRAAARHSVRTGAAIAFV
jgi:nucleotide-binding universal stress UspA family protein